MNDKNPIDMAIKALDEIFLTMCHTTVMDRDGAYDCQQGRITANQYEKILTALREYRDARGWRTIETAPMDGTYILLNIPNLDKRNSNPVREGKFHRYGSAKTWRIRSGGIIDLDRPTHWMPLPPPATQGD